MELVKLEAYLISLAQIDEEIQQGRASHRLLKQLGLGVKSTLVDINERFFGLTKLENNKVENLQKAFQSVFSQES